MMALLCCAFVLIVGGMTGLALGMERHYRQAWKVVPEKRRLRAWRAGGGLLLCCSPLPCCAGYGFAIGLVLWLGLLGVGVLAVAGLFSLPR